MSSIGDTAVIARVRLAEQASAPGTPAAGYGYLYQKSDGNLYFKDDAGTEFNLTAASGGVEFVDLLDVPTDYTGEAGKLVAVNATEDGLEFISDSAGDVNGPSSATDNALPRFDGTGGKTLQNSGVVVEDDNGIHGYKAKRNAQTGTTYTLAAGDSGKVVELTNAGAVTVTLPNSLAEGFACTLVQGGAGQVTLSAASGATLHNRQSHTKLAGQWSQAALHVRGNGGGAAAEYVLCGDTAA